jgi:hypothetical protein
VSSRSQTLARQREAEEQNVVTDAEPPTEHSDLAIRDLTAASATLINRRRAWKVLCLGLKLLKLCIVLLRT